jgi:hypothetical protein
MTSKEFVIWLKGFTDGVHEFNITPKQWDTLKEKLVEVSDEERIGTPIGVGGWGTPNTFITPPPTDPYNPFKITCSTGSFGTTTPGFAVTTTPGTTGYITIANPMTTTLWNPSGSLWSYTSTAYGYPSGSAWNYTTSNEKIF